MPLYAFNSKKQLIGARDALKQKNYFCVECQGILRLRSGIQRQSHFYHLDPTPFCRQHPKGPVHLHIQSYFFRQLPPGDCQLECPFPSIRRIADVAWLSQKIVFEIQYSSITAEEVLARNQDYQKAGWKVIWILHDRRYNQIRLSAAELALKDSAHFFSNMDAFGKGMVYDQFDIWEDGLRHERLAPLPISLEGVITNLSTLEDTPYPLKAQSYRLKNWGYSFEGDLLSIFFKNSDSEYIQEALKREQQFFSHLQASSRTQFVKKWWHLAIARPYQMIFQFLLERMCR